MSAYAPVTRLACYGLSSSFQGVCSPEPTMPRGDHLKQLASRPHIAGLKGGLDHHQPYYAQDRSKGREAQYEPQFEQAEIALRQWLACGGGLKS